MNSKQAVDTMREKKKEIGFFKEQRSSSIKINLGNLGVIKQSKQEATEIYEKFKDGCGGAFEEDNIPYICNGKNFKGKKWLCPNCQEIKEINDTFVLLDKEDGDNE